MHNKVLCTTQCDRPHYTKKWIEKTKQCDDIENYKLIVCVEPVNDEVIALLESIDFCEKLIVKNPQRLGIALNTRQALQLGFNESEFIIYIESDCLLAKDALTKTYNIGIKYAGDEYATIVLPNRHLHVNGLIGYKSEDFDSVIEGNTFLCWAFGAWKKNFAPVFTVMCDKECQSCREIPNLNYRSFNATDFTHIKFSDEMFVRIIRGLTHPSQDIIINNYFQHHKKKHLQFSLGRAINIGIEGTHLPENEIFKKWWEDNVKCDIWSDNIGEMLQSLQEGIDFI